MFGIFEEIADAVSAVWHKCKNCGVWHRGGYFATDASSAAGRNGRSRLIG